MMHKINNAILKKNMKIKNIYNNINKITIISEQAQWDSTLSFLFAMIGVAVGLGNIWRFSYVVYSNGGGTFFIPYLIAIAILGIPFLILEYGIGYSFKDSFSNVMKRINPKLEFVSWILLLFVFIVLELGSDLSHFQCHIFMGK